MKYSQHLTSSSILKNDNRPKILDIFNNVNKELFKERLQETREQIESLQHRDETAIKT